MDKVRVRINIGMAEAVRAGKSEYGRKVVEINPADLTPEEREVFLKLPWTYYRDDATHRDENVPDLNKAEGIPPGIDGSLEDIKRLLAANTIAQAKAAEEKAAKAQEEKAKLEAEINWLRLCQPIDCVVKEWGVNKYRACQRLCNLRGKSQDADGMFDLVETLCAEKNAEIKAQEKAQKDARDKAQANEEAKAEALAVVKREFIATWVHCQGDDSQKARLKAGLLPAKEVEDIVRDNCFAPIDSQGFARYDRMTHDDVCDNNDGCECDPDDTEFSVKDATEAGVLEFERLTAIKARVAGLDAKCVLRLHTGECGCTKVTRMSILVTVNCGPFTFSREYAVN